MLIKGYFTGYGPYQQGIVEASKFVQNKCFLVVKSIVNAENKCQVVSILNFDENPVKLKRNDTQLHLTRFKKIGRDRDESGTLLEYLSLLKGNTSMNLKCDEKEKIV